MFNKLKNQVCICIYIILNLSLYILYYFTTLFGMLSYLYKYKCGYNNKNCSDKCKSRYIVGKMLIMIILQQRK